MVFIEMVLVGVLVSLVSASLLRNSRSYRRVAVEDVGGRHFSRS
jgi:hypothetical protein